MLTTHASWRDWSEAEADNIRIQDSPSSSSRMDLTTHATPRADHHIHVAAEMVGQHPEVSPWLARYHPLGEGHRQAGTVLGPVQGKVHGVHPLPKTQGQHQTVVPSPLRERDKRQPHQPRTQQESSIDSNSQPMRTAHLAPRPSEKPALALNASKNPILIKVRDQIQIPTLKYTRNQLKDTQQRHDRETGA